jgi:hypothetical protein
MLEAARNVITLRARCVRRFFQLSDIIANFQFSPLLLILLQFLLRGLPHLCTYMPAFKECRRLAPDPDNEPDFYAISLLWPVPLKSPQAPVAAVAAAAASKSSEATHTISNEMLMSMFAPASVSEKPSALKSVGSILALPRAPLEAPSLLAGLLTTLPAPQLSSLPVRSNTSEPTQAVSNDMLMNWLSSASQKPPAFKTVERILAPSRAVPQAPSFVAGPGTTNSAAAIIAAALTGRLPPQPQARVATVRDAAVFRNPVQPQVQDTVFRNPVQPQVQDTVAAGNAAIIAAALQNPDWFRRYMGSGRM